MANDLECCFIGRGLVSMQKQIDVCPTLAAPNTNVTKPLGNVSVFQVAPTFEEKSQKDFRKASGNACETKLISSINLNFTVNCMKSDILALAQGSVVTDITATTVTDERHRVNSTSDIVHFNFIANKTPTIVVTNLLGTVTYVAGTDYTLISPTSGSTGTATGIQILSTGAIVSGADVLIDYTKMAQKLIDPYSLIDQIFTVYFDGFNSEDNSSMYVTYWRVKVGAATTIDWINDDYAQLVFEGEVLFDDCNNQYARVLRQTV